MARNQISQDEARRMLRSAHEQMDVRRARNREIEARPDYAGYAGSDGQFLAEELCTDFADRIREIGRWLRGG